VFQFPCHPAPRAETGFAAADLAGPGNATPSFPTPEKLATRDAAIVAVPHAGSALAPSTVRRRCAMADDLRFPNGTGPVEADVVLPAQWYSLRTALPESERRLRLAILEDALRYYRRHRHATDRRARALYEDAAEWFASPDRSEPFAFENVCDALGLDASAVRRSLDRGPVAPPARPHRYAA